MVVFDPARTLQEIYAEFEALSTLIVIEIWIAACHLYSR